MTKSTSLVTRTSITGAVQNRVWARAAGRCVLCAEWLIDKRSFFHSRSVAEIAHNVGATSGSRSPRSASGKGINRAAEDNLLLLCHPCHRQIDDPALLGMFTVEYLRDAKLVHERRVREVTDFATLRKAAILTVVGSIRNTVAPPSTRQIAEALHPLHLTGFGEDTRTGTYKLLLTDAEHESWAWPRGAAEISRTVDSAMAAVAAGDVEVLAVFALAPIPLLVHLGSRLDDKTETVLFGRARRDDVKAWVWPANPAEPPTFTTKVQRDSTDRQQEREVVLTVNVSADVKIDMFPANLAGFPLIEIRPAHTSTGVDVIDSIAALENFSQTWQATLTFIENEFPRGSRIHVIAAVPVHAAIQMGRIHMRDAQADLLIYQRTGDAHYEAALSVGR